MAATFRYTTVRLLLFICVAMTVLLVAPADGQAVMGDEAPQEKASQVKSSPAQFHQSATPSSINAWQDLPFFEIPGEASRSFREMPNHSEAPREWRPRVSEFPQSEPQTLPEENEPTEVSGLQISGQSEMYGYLNYVTLSCVAAFENLDEFPIILIAGQDELSAESGDADQEGSQIQDSATTSETIEDAEAVDPGERSDRRLMSSIRLGDAISTVSETGEPLPTPDSQNAAAAAPHIVEHHFVPAPWNRSHPPRNVYRIRYQPLYFEDPNLERCGDSNRCLTEVASIAHFAARIPLLPYMMASDSPHKVVDSLKDCPTGGHFGPTAYLPKPTVKAIAAEAAAIVAGVYIIP